MMKTTASVVGLLCAAALAAPALAQSGGELTRLNACIAKIETDANGAYEDGLAWSSEGNRPAARHCTALALVALGREEEGAMRLEQLANAIDGGTLEARTIYLTQAGNAWLLAGAPEAAIVALTNAIKLQPSDANLFKDRARAHLAMKAWDNAGSDLNTAIRLSPGDAESLHLRAQALMKMDRLEDAWSDIVAAMRQSPRDVAIVITRGDIREAMRKKGVPDPAGLE